MERNEFPKRRIFVAAGVVGIVAAALLLSALVGLLASQKAAEREEAKAMSRDAISAVEAAIGFPPIDCPGVDDPLDYFRSFRRADGTVHSRVVGVSTVRAGVDGGLGEVVVLVRRAHYDGDGSLSTMPDGSPEIVSDKATLRLERRGDGWSIVGVESHP